MRSSPSSAPPRATGGTSSPCCAPVPTSSRSTRTSARRRSPRADPSYMLAPAGKKQPNISPIDIAERLSPQTPLQQVSRTSSPVTGSWNCGNTFPQAPQLFRSISVLIQTPSQHTTPSGAQTLPQAPQWPPLVERSTQPPLQHAMPSGQTLPQSPQLLGSVRTPIQAPLQKR